MLVAALALVLVAIAMIWNLSRRQASGPSAAIENAAPAAPPPEAAGPEPAPAVSPVAPRRRRRRRPERAAIARAIEDGRSAGGLLRRRH